MDNASSSNQPPEPVTRTGSIRRAAPRILLVLLFLAIPAMAAVLTFIEVEHDGIGGVEGLDGAHALSLSPGGRHLYVAGGKDDAVAVFVRDATNETLTFSTVAQDETNGVFGLLGVSDVETSPDGRHVYASAFRDNSLVAFRRNPNNGSLVFLPAQVKENGVGGVFGLSGASGVAASRDGRSVYVSGSSSSAVAIFSRDASSDALVFRGAASNPSLVGASSVAVSPDGEVVYVTAELVDNLAVFSRDASTDALALTQVLSDGVAGVDALDRAAAVAVSPDSKHVYVASPAENAIAIFERQDLGGSISSQPGRPPLPVLSYLGRIRNGVGGVKGLGGVSSVSLSADGEMLFATGSIEDSVAVFRRSANTGRLTFLGGARDGLAGVSGLDGAADSVASGDGQNLYVAGRASDSVVAFELEGLAGMPTTQSGSIAPREAPSSSATVVRGAPAQDGPRQR